MSMKLSLIALAAVALASTVGCAGQSPDENTDDSGADLIRKTSSTSSWQYHGIMPELESPQLTVSLKGHTVHLQGLLPRNVAVESLPFHVKTEAAPGGRTMVHAAYPIATVNTHLTAPSGLPARNPEPFDYSVCAGTMSAASVSEGAYGGFPFIEYICHHRDHDGRVRSGIAFHGPIDDKVENGTDYWFLQRGPVSHACNRMLGEHVLELAHAIGFDHGVRGTPAKVIADFDQFNGKPLDVDYPSTGWTRPAGAEVFKIWQAVAMGDDGQTHIQMPQWACESSRCANMPANTLNPHTGEKL